MSATAIPTASSVADAADRLQPEGRAFIDGQYVDAADGRTTPVVNPATSKQYGTAPLSSAADIDAAMGAAAAAFEEWRDSTPSERSLALFRIADAVEARAEELIATEVENTGKPVHLTRSEEIPPMVDQIRFFATAARHLEGKSAGEYMRNMTSMIRREPVGVCAQVAPWNYPMMMAVWKFAPAIAAGNTVVLKPSDTTPATTTLLAEIAAEFLPPGVFNVICGDRDTGRGMVTHDVPSMVSITGSVRAGMQVAEAASQSLKRVHLELGGKAANIVFDDAAFDQAVEGVVNGEGSPKQVIEKRRLKVVSDDSALMKAIEAAIASQPDTAQRVRDGNIPAAGALIGAVMKATGGQADAARVRELLLKHLGQ